LLRFGRIAVILLRFGRILVSLVGLEQSALILVELNQVFWHFELFIYWVKFKMAPITRSRSQRAKDALEHVLKTLENKKFQEVFAEAGISDMDEFLMVEIDDLKEVTPIDERGNLIKLNLVEIGKLKKLSNDKHST